MEYFSCLQSKELVGKVIRNVGECQTITEMVKRHFVGKNSLLMLSREKISLMKSNGSKKPKHQLRFKR